MTLRLRHLAQINPGTTAFDSLPPDAELTFMPLETVWADSRLDTTRVAAKATVTSGYVRFQDGDVLVPKTAPTFHHGRSTLVQGLVNGLGAGSSELHLLRPRSNADARFLSYVVRSSDFIRQGVAAYQGVAGLQRVPADFIADWPVAPWTLDEQRRIADFLDDQVARLDRAIALTKRQSALTTEQTTSQVDAAVRGAHIPGPTKASSFEPLRQIPATWIEARLRSVRCEVQTGPFGSQLHAEDYVANGWPVVNPANIRDSGLVADAGMMIDNETRGRLSQHILREGDVIFGRRGELGRSALVKPENAGWVCGTGSLRIRFAGDEYHADYLAQYLDLRAVKSYFERQSVGSTMDNLNTSILLNMPLLIPPLSEQLRIANLASTIRERGRRAADLLGARLRLLEERKQAIITAAVTGEFDVTTARAVAS